MHLVLHAGNKGEHAPVHADGDLASIRRHNGAGAVVVVLHHAVQRHPRKPGAIQRGLHGAHLPLAAVQQDHAGQHRKLPGAPFFVFRGPARERLGHAGIVVGAEDRLHFEPPVAALFRAAVLKHHHAAHAGAVAPVGNIVALDHLRRLRKAQHRRRFVQKALLAVGAAALAGQALHRVGVCHVHKFRRIPPLRHIKLHLCPPGLAEQAGQILRVLGRFIHRNDLGDLLPIQVIPGQKFLPQRRQIGGPPEQKLPLVRQAAAAVAQNGRAAVGPGPGKGHHVHLHALVHHHLLPGGHLFNGGNLVPQKRGLLKIQPFAGSRHALFQGFHNVLFAVPDQPQGSLHRLVVGLPADPPAAQRHALADVRVQAGAALADLLGEASAAPGQQKGVLGGFHHLPHRKARGIRANVVGVVVLFLQHGRNAGIFLFRHLHIAVALVVLQQDVVFRCVGLDLARFQHQRLEFALAHDHVKVVGVLDHLGDLGVVGHPFPEILAHPGAQALCLADINNHIPLVPNDIHTGQKGQHFGFFVQFGFGHRRCGPSLSGDLWG